MSSLTADIKARALRLGFHKIGIARAERLDAESQQLEEWLARGYHGTMGWLARKNGKRADPRNVLPGARSVIAVAMNYYVPVEHSDDPTTGKISRYAWGDDYHEVLHGRLEELFKYIKETNPGTQGKVYVDTGPVMEKVWAQRAGIGWQGKHTNIITEELGSWVFLGEVIIDLELEYDQPAVDLCGSCTLCIEACPTQAIVEPYVLDSNRCISYLTIEHRGPIDAGLGEQFGNWIYGCDICQDVCPWNVKFSRAADLPEFNPRTENIAPALDEIASLSAGEFSARFRKSPVKRTKREGLTRNVRVVISATRATEQK